MTGGESSGPVGSMVVVVEVKDESRERTMYLT